ncbi:Uncharacterised protein [Collinsella intestinalis]|nr:Uncharacterised protein [Collinsella intestinalis]
MGGAITVAERLVIRLNAIVETRKNAGAFHLEGHPILGSRDNDTIGILDIHREVREVGSIRLHLFAVDAHRKSGGAARSLHTLAARPLLSGDLPARFVKCLGGDGAVGIRDIPRQIQVLMSGGLLTIFSLVDAVSVPTIL